MIDAAKPWGVLGHPSPAEIQAWLDAPAGVFGAVARHRDPWWALERDHPDLFARYRDEIEAISDDYGEPCPEDLASIEKRLTLDLMAAARVDGHPAARAASL